MLVRTHASIIFAILIMNRPLKRVLQMPNQSLDGKRPAREYIESKKIRNHNLAWSCMLIPLLVHYDCHGSITVPESKVNAWRD